MRQTDPVESLLNIRFLAIALRLEIGDSLSERLTTQIRTTYLRTTYLSTT